MQPPSSPKRPVRKRRRPVERSVRAWGALLAAAVACCIFVYTPLGGRVSRPAVTLNETAGETRPDGFSRVVHPYSVIPGGVRSAGELSAAAARDPVVAAHYRDAGTARMRESELAGDLKAYVSYRVGETVYWTRKPVRMRKGEPVLADGADRVRQRCGNRISEVPREPAREQDPPEWVWDEVESSVENGLRSMPAADEPLPAEALPAEPPLPPAGVTFANLGATSAAPPAGPLWPPALASGWAFTPPTRASVAGSLSGGETGGRPGHSVEPPAGLDRPPNGPEVWMPAWIPPPSVVAPPLDMIPAAAGFPAALSESLPLWEGGAPTPGPTGSETPRSRPSGWDIVFGGVPGSTRPGISGPPAVPGLPPGGAFEPFWETPETTDIPEPAALLLALSGLLWLLRAGRAAARKTASRSTGAGRD